MIKKMQVFRKHKWKSFSLFIVLALLVGVIAIAARSDPSVAERRIAFPSEPNAARRTFSLLSGIPQHGSVLGFRKAPITLQFFGDLQCIDSRRVMLGALPFLIRRWVRAGTLQIRFRSWESDTQKAGGWYEFREQQGAALAAGEQGKLWNFIDVFYREQGPEFTGYADDAFLNGIAVQAGINLEAWGKARTPPERWVGQLEHDARLANGAGLENTPSFLIGPTGGASHPLRHFGFEEPKVFEEAINRLL